MCLWTIDKKQLSQILWIPPFLYSLLKGWWVDLFPTTLLISGKARAESSRNVSRLSTQCSFYNPMMLSPSPLSFAALSDICMTMTFLLASQVRLFISVVFPTWLSRGEPCVSCLLAPPTLQSENVKLVLGRRVCDISAGHRGFYSTLPDIPLHKQEFGYRELSHFRTQGVSVC